MRADVSFRVGRAEGFALFKRVECGLWGLVLGEPWKRKAVRSSNAKPTSAGWHDSAGGHAGDVVRVSLEDPTEHTASKFITSSNTTLGPIPIPDPTARGSSDQRTASRDHCHQTRLGSAGYRCPSSLRSQLPVATLNHCRSKSLSDAELAHGRSDRWPWS